MRYPPRQIHGDMVQYAPSSRERDNPTVGARIYGLAKLKRRHKMDRKFVKENRAANADEINAIKKALDEFGVKDVCSDFAFLFGRYDAPYGWYLFKLNVNNDHQTKFLILGDCLDVLPDYDRLLTLKDVHEFAFCEMDGRYEAMQKWGVFQSLSMGLKIAIANVVGDEGLDEVAEWDDKRKEWMLRFDVSFTTESNADCFKTIRIPAMFSTKEDADNEFAKEWEAYRKAFSVEDKVREYTENGFSFTDATQWAEGEERSIVAINDAIREFFGREKDGVTESVWVLTIKKDGQNFPEVHKTFDGAVESAIVDIQEHMDEEDEGEYDFDAIKKEIAEERYWKDENTNTVYDVCECPLCK